MRSTMALGLLAIHAATGCSPFSVNSDYDTGANFSKFKTWNWFVGPGSGEAELDGLTEGRIRAALEAELPGRGLVYTTSRPADVHVAYHAAVSQRLETTPTTAAFGYGWGSHFAAVGTGTTVEVYDEGTLVIDLVDPASKNLVWRGTARSAVNLNATPEAREARIRQAVRRILEQYPPAK